jgi:hypothetical protein
MANCKCGIWMFEGLASCEAIEIVWLGTHWTLAKNLKREKQWQLSNADLILADRFGPTDGQAITTVWLGTHYELLQRTCEERKAMTTIECWLGSWWPLWAYRWRSDWNCMAWHSLRALAKTGDLKRKKPIMECWLGSCRPSWAYRGSGDWICVAWHTHYKLLQRTWGEISS